MLKLVPIMKTAPVNTTKASAALSQKNKRSSTYRTKLRRRNLSSHTTPRLSPCPEESSQALVLVTSSVNNSPHRPSRPSSPEPVDIDKLPPSQNILPDGNFVHRPMMPPGPPTSPVPSPPPPMNVEAYPDSSAEDTSVDNYLETCSTKCPPSIPSALRSRLRRRRNAICGSSALGQGLKDFFASYVMSHLTESMTSSLRLDSINESNHLCSSNPVNRSHIPYCSKPPSPLSVDTDSPID
ncbi:unnamed protein product [Calicophoron daubneyi]|uniref:Uncharacterized protein n=1 Tax=Calicophoron daubneyi TaxID=300641 RepID=A0AAV2TVQ1_CALDB